MPTREQEHVFVAASANIDEIETELKRLGQWSDAPLPPSALENIGPFGQNAMTFMQWLQFVLIPRVREIIATRDQFPSDSSVGAYAVHELDGMPDGDRLIQLLIEFDDLFPSQA